MHGFCESTNVVTYLTLHVYADDNKYVISDDTPLDLSNEQDILITM